MSQITNASANSSIVVRSRPSYRALAHRTVLLPTAPCPCIDCGSLGNHGTLTIFFCPLQRTKSPPLAKPRRHSLPVSAAKIPTHFLSSFASSSGRWASLNHAGPEPISASSLGSPRPYCPLCPSRAPVRHCHEQVPEGDVITCRRGRKPPDNKERTLPHAVACA